MDLQLDDGQRAVLYEMSGDCNPNEWASILWCRAIDVMTFCSQFNLPLRPMGRRWLKR